MKRKGKSVLDQKWIPVSEFKILSIYIFFILQFFFPPAFILYRKIKKVEKYGGKKKKKSKAHCEVKCTHKASPSNMLLAPLNLFLLEKHQRTSRYRRESSLFLSSFSVFSVFTHTLERNAELNSHLDLVLRS